MLLAVRLLGLVIIFCYLGELVVSLDPVFSIRLLKWWRPLALLIILFGAWLFIHRELRESYQAGHKAGIERVMNSKLSGDGR